MLHIACRRGEELLRKRCGLDSPKPSVNLEDPTLLDKLFHLFQGSAGSDAEGVPGDQEGAPPQDDWVMPAGVLLQSRIMSLFTKSLLAANHFPGTVQVIHRVLRDRDCCYICMEGDMYAGYHWMAQ